MDQDAFKPRRALVALFVSALLGTSSALAQSEFDVSDDEAAYDETPRLWMIELAGAPTVEGGDAAALAAEKQEFRRSAGAARVEYQERYSFDTLWNGVTVEINQDHVAKLARLPGVKGVYPVITFKQPSPSTTPAWI